MEWYGCFSGRVGSMGVMVVSRKQYDMVVVAEKNLWEYGSSWQQGQEVIRDKYGSVAVYGSDSISVVWQYQEMCLYRSDGQYGSNGRRLWYVSKVGLCMVDE